MFGSSEGGLVASRCREMSRRARLITVVLLAVVASAGAYRCLETMPVGTGEARPSPDGRFRASVMDYSERSFLAGTARRWFHIRVEGPGILYDFTSLPLPGPYFGSRSSHSVVFWEPDSSAVRFVFPTATLRLRTRPISD